MWHNDPWGKYFYHWWFILDKGNGLDEKPKKGKKRLRDTDLQKVRQKSRKFNRMGKGILKSRGKDYKIDKVSAQGTARATSCIIALHKYIGLRENGTSMVLRKVTRDQRPRKSSLQLLFHP